MKKMKTYARMLDGKPVEIIEPFFGTFEEHTDKDGNVVPRAERWVSIEERFTPEVVATLIEWTVGQPLPEPASPPRAMPTSVTMRQARLALLASGLLDGVNATINALPSPQKESARIEWEYAATVDRDSVLIGMLGAALGLDEAALDSLFSTASSL